MTWSTARSTALAAALLVTVCAAVPATAQGDELERASQLLKQGRLEGALSRVDAYLKTRPRDARGRFLKGLILAEQNKPDDAIRIFGDLTQDFPELPEPYNNLAVLYASQGQYDKARSALETAIRTHPSYATAHENLGDIYAKMASQAYDKALSLDKGNAPLQTKLNLIRDLFPGTPESRAAAARPERLAAAPQPKPVPEAAAAPKRAPEPAAKPKPAPEPVAKPKPAPEALAEPAEPVPAPQVAEKPAPARPAGSPDEVIQTVNQWASAWSNNDVAAYLAHYAPDFRTPKGEPRAQWEAQRRARIAKPRRIEVGIESVRVKFNEPDRATVTFRQHYRSDPLKISSNKTLLMVKQGGQWLIQQERVGG